MANRTKKQHYVPQFLLRNFSTGSQKNPRIWVLDKSTKAVRPSSVRDAAHENSFYEHLDSDGTCIELEKLLARIDSVGASVINRINGCGRFSITAEDKAALAYFTACQLLRTPMIRKDLDNLRDMIIHKWGPDVIMDDSGRKVSDYGSDDSKLTSLMLLQKDALEFAEILLSKAWFLVQSTSSGPFIISDNPISRHNIIPRPGRGNLGIDNKGIEIYLPISCKYSLLIVCPVLASAACMAPNLGESFANCIVDGTPIRMRPENITHINACQVRWAERFVYARSKDDLELPLDMLRTNPELMKGPGVRQRPEEV